MNKFIVISHTHWDREWYLPFEVFRLKLCDLIDRLLVLLEKDRDYIFHLDAQTVVLEDYLEMHPKKEKILRRYIESGNIRVGPWYLQNDFYLTDGESTIRNLQIGSRLARNFGRCGIVGYAPDQFGNIPQMPQILKGFGIDTFIFGRGYNFYEKDKNGNLKELPKDTEFLWKGVDGTRCLAVFMRGFYNNAQRIPAKSELAKLLLDLNARSFKGLNKSPFILLMNGVDHLEAQDDLIGILKNLQEDGIDIEQTGLDEYSRMLHDSLENKELSVYEGALDKGNDSTTLRGCHSSRVYLKQANVKMQDLLIRKLEPLYSYLEMSGFKGIYPHDEMLFLWKSLIKNHPHDSICGCSTDAVHAHMEDRYLRIKETAEELLHRGLRVAAQHSGHPRSSSSDYCITVFNGTALNATQTVECELNFFASENIRDFALYDDEKNSIPYEIASKKRQPYDVFSPLNLPGVIDADTVRIRFEVKDIPPFTAKVYAVTPHEKGVKLPKLPKSDFIENEYYRLEVNGGNLILTDLTGDSAIENPFYLEERDDFGDSYQFHGSGKPTEYIYPARVSITQSGNLRKEIKLRFDYRLPADPLRTKGSSTRKKQQICDILIGLTANSDIIELTYKLKNKAKNHRTRLCIKSGLNSPVLRTDGAFDCAERTDFEHCTVTEADTHSNSTFAALTACERNCAVFTEGQHETQAVGGALMLTICRSTGIIQANPVTFKPVGGSHWLAPQNQCLRDLDGRLGIRYGKTLPDALLYEKAKLFRCGFSVLSDSFDPKKYSGGRFAVQATELQQLYYVDDPFKTCRISVNNGINVQSNDIAVSCLKASEKGGLILRLFNMSDHSVTAPFNCRGKIYKTDLAEQNETFIGENSVILSFGKKEIITLRIK